MFANNSLIIAGQDIIRKRIESNLLLPYTQTTHVNLVYDLEQISNAGERLDLWRKVNEWFKDAIRDANEEMEKK